MVANIGPASALAGRFDLSDTRADRRSGEERRFSHRATLHDARGAVATMQALLATRFEPGGELEPTESDILGAIALEVVHLSRLLDRELDRSEPDACDLASIAQDVVRAHRFAHEMTVLWRGERAEVSVGETTVWRVLNNLVANACCAAGPEGLVAVTAATSCDETEVDVRIDDSGSGLSAIDGRIGLGLETVACLVARSGGAFALEPSPLGGTRASVTFPGARLR
jgi:signal transduction histidine kinase